MASPAEKHEEESLIASVVDVLEAGQRVLLDRVELLAVETRLLVSSSITSLALVLVGLGLLLIGWVAANVFVILTLAPAYCTHAQAVALVAALNVALGAIALAIAKRKAGGGAAPDRRAVSADVPDGGASA